MKNSVFMIPLGADSVLYRVISKKRDSSGWSLCALQLASSTVSLWRKKPTANKCRKASEGDAIHMH